jgi:hypothetical protein
MTRPLHPLPRAMKERIMAPRPIWRVEARYGTGLTLRTTVPAGVARTEAEALAWCHRFRPTRLRGTPVLRAVRP